MGNTKVIRSGDVRYDRDNKEVKLVRAFVSEIPEKNLWAVMYTDKKMGVVDLGQATNYGKRFFTKKPKKGKPLTIDIFFWTKLAIKILKFWFVVKQIQV